METPAKAAVTNWGASPADWDRLLALGLADDLLPVVSNPGATISPHSKIAGIGKTPSHYNGLGHVAGLPNWTEKKATTKQIDGWRGVPDYGICLQTRHVRALDIDVADAKLAQALVDFIEDELVLALPKRFRDNSGKCLLAFIVEGELAKRMLPVEGGMVEFLGNGQQFIAHGTHPSGVRYRWLWNGHVRVPVLTAAEFDSLWDKLVDKFAAGEAATGGLHRKKGERMDVDDPTLDTIEKLGLALGYGRDGQVYVECPWKEKHSSDTGVAQTAYFPKGTRGYEQGHFHCLHSSCKGHDDGEFLQALGVTKDQFEVISPSEDPRTGEEKMPMPALVRDTKGEIKAIAHNVNALLERPDITGLRLRFDTFRDEIMWSPYGKAEWQPFSDEHNTELRIRFDRVGFKSVSKDLMRDCVHHVALKQQFDSAVAWLNTLKWDGVSRVDNFAARYLGAADTPYTRAVSLYLWTALAGRVIEPGAKADMALILVGEQGARKSTAVQALAPGLEFFAEIDMSAPPADLVRQMRGKLVGELAELQGLRTRELENIKAFIARPKEEWVPKYKEFTSSYPRRIVFVGTSNHDDFLADETGNRRWLPMRITRCDTEAIKRDRNQLWAEGRELFELLGIDHLSAESLGRVEHHKFRSHDAWEDVVAKWLGAEDVDGIPNAQREYIRNADVMQGALNIGADRMKKGDEMRLGHVMIHLGFTRKMLRDGDRTFRAWVKE